MTVFLGTFVPMNLPSQILRNWLLPILSILLVWACEETQPSDGTAHPTPYENGNGNQTATYDEILEFYRGLARDFPSINLQTLGETDSGHPLHLVTFNPAGDFNFQRLREEKTILFILNGIHPGESDGIDASMLLIRDLATGIKEVPENVVLAAVPVYNVGGALNRNQGSRANQNGPESYGFRGNARNYDLNRDFIKMDTRNARSFADIFHLIQPDFFVDTHVSNGADYSYTLTHLFSQPDKLGGAIGDFQEDVFRPALEEALLEAGWDITPYVNVFGRPPDGGFEQFMDLPRYSTGYAALWNTPGLMLETHMLKPYGKRVKATYDFLFESARMVAEFGENLRSLRVQAQEEMEAMTYYPLSWVVDSTDYEILSFKGYEADTITSLVTDLPQLRYDPSRPYTRDIPYYNTFRGIDSVKVPAGYIVPSQWEAIRERLDWNHIQYETLDRDTALTVTSYRIRSYQTYRRPYEGHYPHYSTQVEARTAEIKFKAGDLWVPTGQAGLRYILETLEPQASDSFFNWNFFDPILQRKEGFSSYVFEETARGLLEQDTILRQAFEARKASDAGFRTNAYAQLNWLFERSDFYEQAHLQYPIYRVE